MLLLKRHLVELVRTGQKRQTVRLWSRPLLRAGQISYTPGLGKMKITAIDKLPSLSALTEADAKADGFPTLHALLAEIHKIYGKNLPANRHVYRIRFTWPIDAAGKTLILPPPARTRSVSEGKATATSQITRRKPQTSLPPTTKPITRKSHMTAPQRQALRTYILSRKPA